jgi:uncharacterized RDD family membrane protein YckC
MANQPCYECGKIQDQSAMIQYSGSWICADCKPVFMQKLKEGVAVTGSLRYAGFWIRFAAWIIDFIILYVVNLVLNLIFFPLIAGATKPGSPPSGAVLGLVLFLIGIEFLIHFGYHTYFVGKLGATPGKMACGIRIVSPTGEPISYGLALGRTFAHMLCWLTLTIGYIIAAFDDEKRGLHDRVCGTRVIYAR